MSAPTLQAEGLTAAVTTGNLVVTLPTYAADDIVIINTVGWVPNTATGANTQSLASPWTKYSPNVTTITSSLIDAEYAIWWARATSNSSLGTTVTITRPTSWDTGTDTCWGGRAYVIRGCATTGDPFDAWTASAVNTAANAAFPGVSYTAGNNLVVQFLCVADNTSVGTAPSGWTAGTEDADTAGTDCTFQTFRQTFSTGGTATSTASTSSVAAPANSGSGYVFFGVSFTDVPVTRTGSDTGTGTESATGARVGATITRTASDTGTGTESANRLVKRLRTASDTGTGTEAATGNFFSILSRTASDTGTGTESASYNIVPGTPAHQRTATGDGTGTESATGQVVPVVQRTASNTGTGTESATGRVVAVVQRTASNTGSGTETAVGLRKVLRTASNTGTGTEAATGAIRQARTAANTGTGTESATPNIIKARTGSNTGTGTESAERLLIALRTASNTGTGTETAQRVVVVLRTATASGAGTQAASGNRRFEKTGTATGVGTETPANWAKSFIFRPPVNDEFRYAEYLDHTPAGQLFGRVAPATRADNIYKLVSGTYTTVDPMDPTLVAKIYFGGHNNFVDADEKADLIAAGYTVT